MKCFKWRGFEGVFRNSGTPNYSPLCLSILMNNGERKIRKMVAHTHTYQYTEVKYRSI